MCTTGMEGWGESRMSGHNESHSESTSYTFSYDPVERPCACVRETHLRPIVTGFELLLGGLSDRLTWAERRWLRAELKAAIDHLL